MSDSEFLFLEEVAARCRVPRSTAKYWVSTGKLPSFRPGRRHLVRHSDLEAFIAGAALRRPATKAP